MKTKFHAFTLVVSVLALVTLFSSVLPALSTKAQGGNIVYLPAVVAPIDIPAPDTTYTQVDLTKGPDLIYTDSSSAMSIFWQWTSNTSFYVDWGTDTRYGLGRVQVSAYDTTNHLYTTTITGLSAGKKYFYRVVVGKQASAGTFFAAPGDTAASLKFVSYGDTRTNGPQHDAVAGQVVSLFQSDPAYQTLNPMVGDLVTNGDIDYYWTNEFYAPPFTHIRTELANMAVLPVMGNHEGTGGLFTRYFPLPFTASRYWSFDYGPAHFVMLDQYAAYGAGSAQYNWLKEDLASSTMKWKIVVLHEPGWSAGGGHANNTAVQQDLQPLFKQYNVALVLGGHNHYYARAVVDGVTHLTLGTGGAPLSTPQSGYPNVVATYKGYGYTKFSISGSSLTAWLVDSSDTVRDTFTITR